MNLTATNRYGQNTATVQTVAGQQVIAQRQSAAQTPSVLAAVKARAKGFVPLVAGGIVLLAGLKIVQEKFIHPGGLPAGHVRIGLTNFAIVGLMAMVFAVGVQTVQGLFAHAQQTMTNAGIVKAA